MKKLMPVRTLASKNSSIGIFINNYTRQVKTPTIDQQNVVNSQTQKALTNESKKQYASSNGKRNNPAIPVQKTYNKSETQKSNGSKLINKSDIISNDASINQSQNVRTYKNSPKKQSLLQKQSQQKINLKIKSENENGIKAVNQSKKKEINQQSQNLLKLRESSSHSQLKTKVKSDEKQKRGSQSKMNVKQSHTPQSSQNFKQMKNFELQAKMKKHSISEKDKTSLDKKSQVISSQKKPSIQQANNDKSQNKSLNRILSLYKKVVPDKIPTTFNIKSVLNLNLTQKISEQLQSRGSQNESPRSNSCLKTSDLVFDLKAENLTKEEKFLKRNLQNSQTSQHQKRVQSSKNSSIQFLKENAERKKQLTKNKTQQSTPLTSINTSQIESYMNQNYD